MRTYKILIPHLRLSRVLTNRLIFRNEYRYSLSYHLYIRNVFLVDNSSFLLAILWKTFIKSVLSCSPYYASIISINSCLYASISLKTSIFMGFLRPHFLFLSPTTPFLHHFILNYTFSQTFPFLRTAYLLLRGNTSPLSFVMCHVPRVSARFSGSCHIRLLLWQKYAEVCAM